MKRTLLTLSLLACLPVVATAQRKPADPADLRAKLEKKLAKPFVKGGGWLLDYDVARAKAKEDKKLVFVYFTRSFAP